MFTQALAIEQAENSNLLDKFIDSNQDPDSALFQTAEKIASMDKIYQPSINVEIATNKFFQFMAEAHFLPDPQIITQCALNEHPMLFSDTALCLEDNQENIYQNLQRTATCLQNHINVSIDFSKLRPSRQIKGPGAKQCVGPIRFMELFERAPRSKDANTHLNYFLNSDHLDFEDFIDYIETTPSNIRFTLGITNAFMAALANDKSTERKLFHRLINLATKQNINYVFVDPLNNFKKNTRLEANLILNPRNQLIHPHELTAYGFINLQPFFNEEGLLENKLAYTIAEAIHFLDNCFDKNLYVEDSLKKTTLNQRRIALSIIGLEPVLKQYNPENGNKKNKVILTRLASFLKKHMHMASHSLGNKRSFTQNKMRNTQLLAHIDFSAQDLWEGSENHDYFHCWQDEVENIVAWRHTLGRSSNTKDFIKRFFNAHANGIYLFTP
jgi:ribonucleotide reductase alpha subunit